MRGTMYAGSFLANSTVWRYAKKRGLWYYRLLLSNRFADVMSDIFEMTELEKKLNKDYKVFGNTIQFTTAPPGSTAITVTLSSNTTISVVS